ncbi:ADP-ribosylglycohydrolase family protein [Kriegella aquimaris]|uniref:ADP-ribosylglycohydrolase n=1 Tax=Kriegella aquimaris TaxID=192904 RepID=A0A1G9MDM3_9FLAO|nr:ADP-ribosylglycohydrolase family protein [Kriegella aquimaris]SDL72362.1 ADP-ribosylglycohydrolase [Kriegella aquimaris]
MKKILSLLSLLPLLAGFSCKEMPLKIDIEAPKKIAYGADTLKLSETEKYDKVLGALVGSAIGDAMGASTEMWHRKDIQLKYGYITGLTPAVRTQSPEGTWGHNLSAGTTTDDTRWKLLMVKYFSDSKGKPEAKKFSKFITDYYQSLARTLADKDLLTNTDLLDEKIEKMDWIKEWARVSLAYQESDEEYQKSLNRFYGGEMSCAGQLYTPMFGLIAHNVEGAYNMGYAHSIFDLGYAKDISGLVAAMTQMAMRTQNMDSILNTATFVDPNGYQDSRLVGRIAYSVADVSIKHVLGVNDITQNDSVTARDSLQFKMPKNFTGAESDWVRQEMVYQFLEKNEKAIAFHSGEIWQILVTALQFGEGDFTKTMQFIVNYGRDNDTVAAVVGMILGAKDGFSNLPEELRNKVLKVNKEQMGIDLEALAQEMLPRDKETL